MFNPFNKAPSEEPTNPSRRTFLRKSAAAVAAATILNSTEALAAGEENGVEKVGNITYRGFNGEAKNLANVKEGIQFALRQAQTELSKDTPIALNRLPLEITFSNDDKAGTQVHLQTYWQGRTINLGPPYQSSSVFSISKTIETLSFAKHVKQNIIDDKRTVREICESQAR